MIKKNETMENLIRFLKDKALTPNALFFLYSVVNDLLPFTYTRSELILILEALQDTKCIKITDTVTLKYSIRETGVKLIKELDELHNVKVVTAKKLKEADNVVMSDILYWIDEYRTLFKNKKPGATGDKNACITKMARFFAQYPEYANKETVISAATKYINGEGMNANFKYLQKADYFIFKQSANKDEISNLASFCDELESTEEEQSMVRKL